MSKAKNPIGTGMTKTEIVAFKTEMRRATPEEAKAIREQTAKERAGSNPLKDKIQWAEQIVEEFEAGRTGAPGDRDKINESPVWYAYTALTIYDHARKAWDNEDYWNFGEYSYQFGRHCEQYTLKEEFDHIVIKQERSDDTYGDTIDKRYAEYRTIFETICIPEAFDQVHPNQAQAIRFFRREIKRLDNKEKYGIRAATARLTHAYKNVDQPIPNPFADS